ncbi:MAG: hypothetical protein EOP65_15300, partial [Sphingomonas sp.]
MDCSPALAGGANPSGERPPLVIPAKAGTHGNATTAWARHRYASQPWVPACAGMTKQIEWAP